MDAEQIKTLLDMRMAKYPDHACLMQELTFKDEKIAALEAENTRLKEALRECVAAISALGWIVAEVEDACSNWHEHRHVGSRTAMFRIAHAVKTPNVGVAIAKAVVVGKKASEV